VLDKASNAGKDALHIRTTGQGIASWRAKVLLEPGKYRFQARVRTSGVVPIRDQKGEGVGLRISGSQQPRSNYASGDTDWKDLRYEFTVPGGQDEVVLVAEMRASKGDAWFEAESLKLVRVRQ